MTFTRTRSGLNNLKHFFNVDMTLYVEGRQLVDCPVEDSSRPDTKFYNTLCSKYLPDRKVKVKLVGNRRNALDYHDKIINSSIDNSFVIVDRDYDDLTLSHLVKPKLIMTYGYSWENDFWTKKLLLATLEMSTASDENAIKQAEIKIRRTLPRLSKISALNVAAHVNGSSIFPRKGKSKGVRIDVSKAFPITTEEYIRLSGLLTHKCEVMENIHRIALRNESEKVIQGHLLEHVLLKILSYVYAGSTDSILKNNNVLKNIALSLFCKNPDEYISREANDYYIQEFARAI